MNASSVSSIRLRARRLLPGCLLIVSTACGGESGSSGFTLADSAGVALAQNYAPLDQVPVWRLGATPLLTIGVFDGEPAYQFSFALAGARLIDGRIAVIDARAQEVRYFSPDGQHLRTTGRLGSGPGEFREADRFLRLGGDTLLVWDGGLRRLTTLAPDGTVATTTPAPGGMNPYLVNLTSDGGYLLADDILQIPDAGFQDRTVSLSRRNAQGEEAGKIGTYVSGPIGKLGTTGMVGGPLFAPMTSLAPAPAGYFVGTAREYQVARYDEGGTVTRLIRWIGPDRQVSPSEVERHRQGQLDGASEQNREYYERLHASQPVSDQFPAYFMIMTDRAGALRVREFPRPSAPGTAQWLMFDGEGRLVGRLAVPAELRVLEWGSDYLLGVLPDASDVEQVVLYEVGRPGE